MNEVCFGVSAVFLVKLVVFIPPKIYLGGIQESARWSACLSVRPLVGSIFLSMLDLSNHWTNFIQTSQIHSIYSKDVHSIFCHGSFSML